MNLRVLIYSNPLVVDKVSKKFLFWKDSGFIFTKNLISILPAEWRYSWLIPENITPEQMDWFRVYGRIVKTIPYPYSTSIHQNRYEFYGNVLKKEFPYTKDIDIVLNNQPEVSANIKAWLENQRRDQSPIFNFFHWIDCKESRQFAQELQGYFWRQWDGVLSSEKSYFHNQYAKSLFENMVIGNIKKPEEFRTGYFMPPASAYGWDPIEMPKEKIILFNHRLNNTTNWKFFLDVMDIVYETRQDFKVWFTDDSDKAKSKMLERPYVINKSLPDSQYGKLLSSSHFCICTHKGYSTWNMAILDALNAECFTIVPGDETVYRSMFGEVDWMYHRNDISLIQKIMDLLDEDVNSLQEKARYIKSKCPSYFEKEHLLQIRQDIHRAIQDRLPGDPAKYDEVKALIKNHPGISKQEIVNRLWSFHVNSNFQKIRWKLILEGVVDDISSDTTIYNPFMIRGHYHEQPNLFGDMEDKCLK